MGLNFVPGFQPGEFGRHVSRGSAPGCDVSALRAGTRKMIINKSHSENLPALQAEIL